MVGSLLQIQNDRKHSETGRARPRSRARAPAPSAAPPRAPAAPRAARAAVRLPRAAPQPRAPGGRSSCWATAARSCARPRSRRSRAIGSSGRCPARSPWSRALCATRPGRSGKGKGLRVLEQQSKIARFVGLSAGRRRSFGTFDRWIRRQSPNVCDHGQFRDADDLLPPTFAKVAGLPTKQDSEESASRMQLAHRVRLTLRILHSRRSSLISLMRLTFSIMMRPFSTLCISLSLVSFFFRPSTWTATIFRNPGFSFK